MVAKDNYIFINTNPLTNMIWSYGITAADYINGLDELPESIILLNDDEEAANNYNSHIKFNLVTGSSEIRRYLLKKTTIRKKFIDFKGEDSLANLLPTEIAALLYMAHMGVPMHRPFSSKLMNEYIYLTQPDETIRSYYRRFSDFNHILEISIKRNLRELHNSRRMFARSLAIKDIDNSILIDLITKANDGLIIMFGEIKEHKRNYQIPLYILNDPEKASITLKTNEINQNATLSGHLIYDILNKQWDLKWE